MSEFKVVLAHEFGHLAQRSMAVGRWVCMAQQIAEHIVWRRNQLDRFLQGVSHSDIRIPWVGWILRLIVWSIRSLLETLFQGVMLAQRALSREMEFQADLVAVSLTGSDALIHALHHAQAADDACDRTLSFANGELGQGRKIVDLFAVQSRVHERMREMLGNPGYARVPTVPDTRPEAHRVFRAELAQLSSSTIAPVAAGTWPRLAGSAAAGGVPPRPAGDAALRRARARRLCDAQRFLAREYQAVTADGNVSSRERKRLVKGCTVVHTPLAQVHANAERVHLDASLLQRLGVESWASLFEEFKLAPADVTNLGKWLDVIHGWINAAAAGLDRLGDLALEQLLESERKVAPSVQDGSTLPPAPQPARIEADYAYLLPGGERKLQRKLGWWGSFSGRRRLGAGRRAPRGRQRHRRRAWVARKP